MMLLSQAAQVLGCELVGHDVLFTSVSSDSRAINTGDLFIALQGENYDGAAFVASATQSGAVAALVKTTSYRGVGSPCPLLLSPVPTVRHPAPTGLHNHFARSAKKLH